MITGPTIQLHQIWQCNENSRLYQIIQLDEDGVIATTTIPNTPGTSDAFSWQSPDAEFLASFTFVKMGPKPKGPK